MERWRRPIIPVVTEQSTTHYDIVNGEIQRTVHSVLRPEDVARIRAGYACPRCFEPFETPSKEGPCPLCRNDLRLLHEDFEREMRFEHVGPDATLDERREQMIFEAEARRHRTGSSVLVPGA